MECEFCSQEVVNSPYSFHISCLKNAVGKLARIADDLHNHTEENLEGFQIQMVIEPSNRQVFGSIVQAEAVATKLARKSGKKYMIIQRIKKVWVE